MRGQADDYPKPRTNTLPTTISIAPAYSRLENDIVNIDAAFAAGENILYDVRNTIKKIELGGHLLAVKSFRPPKWPQSVIYGRWRTSKAERSFKNAQALIASGIPTPQPVAFTQTIHNGRLTRSYYICEYFEHDCSMAPVLEKAAALEPREDVLAATEILMRFVDFSYRMHESGILHRDHNTGNTLLRSVNNEVLFSIIDINRMKFGKLSLRARLNNFVRLTDNTDLLKKMAQRYAHVADVDPLTCVRILLSKKQSHLRKLALKRRLKKFIRGNR